MTAEGTSDTLVSSNGVTTTVVVMPLLKSL